MTEPTTATGKLIYSIEGLVKLIKTTREQQDSYRKLIITMGKTNTPEDKQAAAVAYKRARTLEVLLDATADSILFEIKTADYTTDPSPIVPPAIINRFVGFIIGIVAVVVFFALWFWIDIDTALFYSEIAAGAALVVAVGYLIYLRWVLVNKVIEED